MADEKKLKQILEIPVWHLRISSKLSKYESRRTIALVLSFIITYTSIVLLYLLFTYYKFFPYDENIMVGVSLIIFVISILSLFKILTKNFRVDKIEMVAYYLGLIGLDLKKILLDENLYTKMKVHIKNLKLKINEICRTLNLATDKTLKNALVNFKDNLDKLNVLVADVKKYDKTISTRAQNFISLGSNIYHSQKIDKIGIETLIQNLQKIPEVKLKEKIDYIIKTFFEKIPSTLFYIVVMSIGIIIAFIFPTDDIMVRLVILNIIFTPAFGVFLLKYFHS